MQLSWREMGKLGKLTSSPFCHNHMPWHQFPLGLSRIFFIVQSFRTCSFRPNLAKKRVIGLLMVANPVTGKSNEERFISSSDLICCLSPLSQPQHLQLHIWRLFGNLRQYLETIWTLYKDNKEREGVENFCHIICLLLGRKISQYFCKNNSDTIGEKGQKISGRDLFWTISRLPEDKLEMVCNIFNFVLKHKFRFC